MVLAGALAAYSRSRPYRRVATRCGKREVNYKAMVTTAMFLLWP